MVAGLPSFIQQHVTALTTYRAPVMGQLLEGHIRKSAAIRSFCICRESTPLDINIVTLVEVSSCRGAFVSV